MSSKNDKIVQVGPEKALLRFYGAPFETARAQRVVFADPWEYEEYAGLEAKGMKMEVFYVSQVGDYTAVRYPYTLQNMINSWNHNAGHQMSGSEESRVDHPLTDIFYQRFTLSGPSRSCAGFQGEWDMPSDDVDHRPGKVLFGYLCAAPGKKLSLVMIENNLLNIGIRGETERFPGRKSNQITQNFGDGPGTTPAERRKALQIAQGGGKSASGHAQFPFEFVIQYFEQGESPQVN